MAKLVDDNIINAIHRCGHECRIEQYTTLFTATAPASRHSPKRVLTAPDPKALDVLHASLKSFRELLFGSLCPPCGDEAGWLISAVLRTNNDFEAAARQTDGFFVTLPNPQAILAAKIANGFAAAVFSATGESKYLCKIALLFEHPSSFAANTPSDFIRICVQWGDHFHKPSRMNADGKALDLAAFQAELNRSASVMCFADHWRRSISW